MKSYVYYYTYCCIDKLGKYLNLGGGVSLDVKNFGVFKVEVKIQ